MCRVKQKAISMICIIALVVSLFGMMPSGKAYGGAMVKIPLDGTCIKGVVDGSAAVYYFDAPVNGTARVGVSSSSASVKLYLSATNSFSYPMYTGTDTTQRLPGGRYYVKVDGNQGATYEISANFKPLNEYDKEPNNAMEQAITMTSGTDYKGHVYASYNDVDWYKLVVKTRSVIHMYLDVASSATAYMFNKDGEFINIINGCAPGLTQPLYYVDPGTYYFQVVPAYNTDWNYTFSARIVERPTENKIKSVTATGVGKAKISWTESKYAEGYYLYKVTNGSWDRIAELDKMKRSYTDAYAPKPGSSCQYAVMAYRFDRKDPYNPHIEVFWDNINNPKTVKYTGKVPVPKSVGRTKYSSSIKVSWNKVSGATGYKVYCKANGGDYKLVKTIKSSSTLYWKDTTVKKGTNYKYKVKAYYKNSSGKVYNGSYSDVTSNAKITGTIAAPSKISAKKYKSYNKVTWSKASGATGYKIYRKTGSGSYKLVKTTTSTTYKDKSVKKGKKYTYKVKAYYKNYTLSKGKYKYKTVYSKYSKTAYVKR